MKPEEIKEWVEEGGEYLEIFKAMLPLVKEVGSEIKPLLESISEFRTENTCKTFDAYIEHGFSREEALQLIMYNKQELSEFLQKVNYSKN